MPVLHKYKARNEYYILTQLNGAIVTYQVTPDGCIFLEKQGVAEGSQFGRSLLLQLCRSGDAYTRASAPDLDLSGWIQTSLDFSDDPVPETSMPVCACCGSPYGLHLVSVNEEGKEPFLSIRCADCCVSRRLEHGICIPAPVLSRPFLKRLIGLSGVEILDESASSYAGLLEKNFMEQLYKRKTTRKHVQDSLFGESHREGQGSLL